MNYSYKLELTRSIWKMLGPFATASRCKPPNFTLPFTRCRYYLSHAACASMSTTMTITTTHVHNNDNAWQRGPLWPHRMGPITTKKFICHNP